MKGFELEVRGTVAAKATALGAPGDSWIKGLPDLLARLAERWSLTLVDQVPGGSESVVVNVLTSDDCPAVLKLAIPGALGREPDVLHAADPAGCCVHPLAVSRIDDALLLERLGPSLRSQVSDSVGHMGVLCCLVQRLWSVPPPAGLPTGADKAISLAGFIERAWHTTGRPCSEQVVNQATVYARRRQSAFDPARSCLVHGDAHSDNALACEGDAIGYKLVDPDGLFAEPALDLAVPMREYSAELLAGDPLQGGLDRCRHLSERTGVPEREIWEWGFLERVSTGLLTIIVASRDDGLQQLEVAESWTKVNA